MGAFKTKARAIELLGRKQIRDSVTALAEIMKNSYDADAALLRVEFLTKDVNVPCIVICDTGIGMDRHDIENKWLVLGTTSKLDSPKQESLGGRPLMGAKGIGRLAVSRLGQQMWMFTKKRNTNWNVLYINWNIFENPELYIENVDIPAVYDIGMEEIRTEIKRLSRIQIDNLKDASWNLPKNTKRQELIRRQIGESVPDWDLVEDFCGIIEENDVRQGTVIFSLNLNDDWERYLDPNATSDDDMFAARNYNRLNSFMTEFGREEPGFTVELFHNGEPLEFSEGFTEEDYEIYDLKIQGCVEHGIFIGQIDARNADETVLRQCNRILEKGISVTAGIKNWENDDCGRYEVKFCHFEMDKKNTGLTPDEWDTIKRRMEKAGGIGVYRDNVRVLPYGEPDNDFLELEERRSKSARYYLFSHRNMFGRIDITSFGNPHLEDKSSREGFIENQYYNYFIRTLQNLLIRISVDFAGDMGKNSLKLRQTYLKYNNEKTKERENIKKFEQEQARLFQKDEKRIRILLKDNPPRLETYERGFEKQLQQFDELRPNTMTSYQTLLEYESSIKSLNYEMEGKLAKIREELHIYIDEKFESKYDPTFLEQIDGYNEMLTSHLEVLRSRLQAVSEELLGTIQYAIADYQANFKSRTGMVPEEAADGLRKYLARTRELLNQMIEDTQDDAERKFEELMDKAGRIKNYEQDLFAFREEVDDLVDADLLGIGLNLQLIERRINDSVKPEDLIDLRGKINEEEENIYRTSDQILKETDKRFAELNGRLDGVLGRFETDDAKLIRQLTVRNNELRQLNEMYADLANLGMAAEIVSHELNQLFNNVYDAINQLRYQGISSGGKYYLNQIDIGFRAISDRMSQMSPMYRSKSMYRKNVNLYEMLESIRSFFANRLEKQSVRFTNDVPQDLELKLSLSKIYPVISNLIYNSLYWVADQKEKEILFRYVEEEHALYIEDSGRGIAIRNKERIFEPFFSLKKGGRGLGLTISKNVLESQGYGISVVTEPEKKYLEGACFKITFGTEAEES